MTCTSTPDEPADDFGPADPGLYRSRPREVQTRCPSPAEVRPTIRTAPAATSAPTLPAQPRPVPAQGSPHRLRAVTRVAASAPRLHPGAEHDQRRRACR